MPPPDSVQYVQIKDFRPGISDNPGANYPPGSAQRANTYRCIANRAGALTPLPFHTGAFAPPAEPTTAAIVGCYLPPIGEATFGTRPDPPTLPGHELMIGVETLRAGTRYVRLYRVRMTDLGHPADTIISKSAADPTVQPDPPAFTPQGMFFGSTRSNRAAPTQPGCPVVMTQWNAGGAIMFLNEWPDDQNQGTYYNVWEDNKYLAGMTCHQGRTVSEQIGTYGQASGMVSIMGEGVIWSAPNDVSTANWSTPPAVWVPENPSGFAFLFSMSANELFGVKLASGGVYVSG